MPARLAQHLAQSGLITTDRAQDALRRQAMLGGGIDTILLEQGGLTEEALLKAMSEVSGVPAVNLRDFEPNVEAASLVPPKIAERLGVVPLSVEGERLHVACSYPVPKSELDEIAFLLGKKLERWVAIEARVRDWISILYRQPLMARYQTLLAQLDPTRPMPVAPAPSPPEVAPPDQPSKLEENVTLEQALDAEMIERLAQSVVEEPILLQVKKRPRTQSEAEPPAPAGSGSSAASMEAAYSPAEAKRTNPTLWTAKEEGPATPQPPAGRSEPEAPVPQWSLEEARERLRGASQDRNQIIEVTLAFSRRTFDFAAAFAVIGGSAVGWAASGGGVDPGRIGTISIPLDSPSVFRTVAHSRGNYIGPPPADSLTRHFLSLLGRDPRTMFLFPIEVKSRLVALLYGDNGPRPTSQRRLSDTILFCQELPRAFEELLVRRRKRTPGSAALPARDMDRASQAKAPASTGGMAGGMGWSPSASGSPAGIGRAASSPAMPFTELNRPPPDFSRLLERLTGPDAALRARAVAELARSPEASAKALVAHFPGPTAWSYGPVEDLPEAEELGPIPGALARLGRAAAQALVTLVDSDDSNIRYFALLTAGSLAYPELVDGVLRGLFDLEPDISSAARAAAPAFRQLARFDAAMKGLRQELAARDPLRRSLAARALGRLHDQDAVDGLIGLTGSDDQMCAQAAADALESITKASFGMNPRQWTTWWAENRSRRRAEWLVAALRHPSEEIRAQSIEELSAALGDALGYYADGPPNEREEAVRRWDAVIKRGEPLDV